MENLEIIILTSVLSTLFIVFITAVVRELKRSGEKIPGAVESGPRAELIRFIGNLFDEEAKKSTPIKERVILYNQVKRTISDMETDGVYFPKEVKEQLERKREELTCEYSGLRSVISYLEENDFHNGHS